MQDRYQRIDTLTRARPRLFSRSKLYELAHKNPGLFKKLDRTVLVDTVVLEQIIAAAPAADLALPPSKRRAREDA
jgi:hypothetical protein